ncbi:MAG: hypothetical protein R3A46_00945 [Thermomicrobiales bacterium]
MSTQDDWNLARDSGEYQAASLVDEGESDQFSRTSGPPDPASVTRVARFSPQTDERFAFPDDIA